MPSQITLPSLSSTPDYCQYSSGRCDQNLSAVPGSAAVFFYAGQPEIIASTIEEAVTKVKKAIPGRRFMTWRDFNAAGAVIFCTICKAMRGTEIIFADVTTLNFNLMFEIGYAIGLGIPVVPIRDTTYATDASDFTQLGIFDTLAYISFTNSDELASQIQEKLLKPPDPIGNEYEINKDQPLYLIKGIVATEGQIKLSSVLDKSGIPYRNFDPQETARISLHEAIRHVKQSHAVIASLMAPQRTGAQVSNARAAFMSGISMASQKLTLMLQETQVSQPLDFRDIVRHYTQGSKVPAIISPFIKLAIKRVFSTSRFVPTVAPLTQLEHLDFGDVAAENETSHLLDYFVATGQYNDVKRGRARLVVGRKGSGKSAIFYGVYEAFVRSHDYVVVDLKPEAHQLSEFRSLVLRELEIGGKEHVLTAFWHYVLLIEIVYKILETEESVASRDPEMAKCYVKLSNLYDYEANVEEGGFSERLYELIQRISERVKSAGGGLRSDELTKLIYEKDISSLSNALAEYLSKKEAVWLLIDGLDKGWPVGGIADEDVLLIRCLLEASRKIQKSFEKRSVNTNAVVFLRNDVCDLLLPEIKDKGKETAVYLDWTDVSAFREIAHRRMVVSAGENLPFDQLWQMYFDSHVNGEESFSYIVSRTLMRPRDLIKFLRNCVTVAVNRSHERVLEADIEYAEKEYSEDQLQELSFELRSVFPHLTDILYVLIGESYVLGASEVETILFKGGVVKSDIESVIKILLWFGILGIIDNSQREKFAYDFRYGVDRLMKSAAKPVQYVVHPAFRLALESKAT